MSTQTPTALFTPEELYNVMMGVIEPDLMTENLKGLAAKYAGETEDERRERFYSYAVSLEICRNAIQEFGGELEDSMQDLAMAITSKMQEEDAKHLETIENSMDQFPSDHVA